MRRTFIAAFDRATELARFELLKQQVDTTSARLIYIGRQFADEWRKGNAGRGQTIPPDQMRQVIGNTVRPDQPLIDAWETNIEYGLRWVQDSASFDDRTIRLTKDLVDHFYVVQSTVLFPTEDVTAYESTIDNVESRLLSLSRDLEISLDNYR